MWLIRRPQGLLCSVLATVLVVAGCGSGPAQVGSAVIVGDTAVPVSQVRTALQWQLDHVPRARQLQDAGKLAQVSRQLAQRRVVHELLGLVAEKTNLRPDEREVSELIDSAGGTEAVAEDAGVAPKRVRQLATDQVLLRELAERRLRGTTVSFVGGEITSESSAGTAEDKARRLARRIGSHPDRAAELAERTDQPVHEKDYALADAVRQAPELAVSAVFGAEPGSVLVIQPSRARAGWLVALVTGRTAGSSTGAASSDDTSSDELPDGADEQLVARLGLRMLQPVADDVGVRINPRYGVWDPTAMDIAPSEQELAGYQFRSRTVRS